MLSIRIITIHNTIENKLLASALGPINSNKPTYQYRRNHQRNIHSSGIEERFPIGDINTGARMPLANFDQRVLLQLQQVQFEFDTVPFLELDRSAQTFELDLDRNRSLV